MSSEYYLYFWVYLCSLISHPSVKCSRISLWVNLFSMFIIPNVIRALFHCLKYYLKSGASLKTLCRHDVRTLNRALALPNYQLPITNYQSPITNYQSPHRIPKSKLRQCLFAKKWGLQSKPRLVCLLWGEGERRYELPLSRYPKTN